MTEELTLIGSVGDLLSSLLGSSVLGLDTGNLSMLGLQLLFTNYNLQSQLDTAYYIPVAASGNYADLMATDKSLSPASLPHVISVGATLGEGGNKWQYSQAAQLLAPGSWYDYSGKNSFVAGTSFAAPMVSMIGALYLTYPAACDFDGVHPPLLDLDYDNVKIKPYYTGFDCEPMLGPDDPVELLTNRSFETSDIKPTSADRWKETKLKGDKRVINQLGMQASGASVELIASGGGVFEIVRDGELVYSKKKLGRFPSDAEVEGVLRV
jgi:selenoprotein W-related protein